MSKKKILKVILLYLRLLPGQDHRSGRPPGLLHGRGEDCYILEQMRDAAAISNSYRMRQDDGTVCYFFGDTCIRVHEFHEGEKICLEPVAGDQTACGEWVELPIDRVHGYCTLLEWHLNKAGG